jgi:peptidoglycan/xylan/chitin deacetylase (PgdA/CDA1 family)
MFRSIIAAAIATLLGLLGGCAPVAPPVESAGTARPVIAITVDDIPQHGGMAPGETRLDLSRRIVAALKTESIPAYGFINGARAEDADSISAVEHWAEAFPVGNHSWSHPNLNDVTADQYVAEIIANEPMLQRLSKGRDWRWFRYPFLAEGEDPEKRGAVRQVLAQRGYRIAAVTMDFSDWAYNDVYARCAAKGDEAAIAALEEDWLDAVRHSAKGSRAVAKGLYGRDVPYVLLTHIGSFDARMFPRMIALYREMGFDFVSLERAQAHPAYAADNDPRLEPRQPIWALMQAKGVPDPAPRAPKVDLATLCI